MVERYAHRMPSELAPQIASVWGASHPGFGVLPVGGQLLPLRREMG